jgi:hypothetical protein
MIGVIKAEQLRRETELDNVDPNCQYDQRQFTDLPFVNELCLMVLVTLRHQVERELVKIAAREGHQGKEISGQDYAVNVQQEREGVRKKGGWEKLAKRLKLEQCDGYPPMEVLRLLVNSHKHAPWGQPDEELLRKLNLELDVKYAPLPESTALREGLAQFIGLEKNALWCDTAEQFVNEAAAFLEAVQKQTALSKVKWGSVSFNPDDMLH